MFSAVIVMAGKGQRMNSGKNKVLLAINGLKVFMYSVKSFLPFMQEIILVVNKGDYDEVLAQVKDLKKVTIVIGGDTRQQSVYNGLCHVMTPYVLIHDAARPFISSKTIEEAMTLLQNDKAVLVASKVKDTIKQLDEKLITLNRDALIAAQTPQGAKTLLMISCHEQALSEGLEFSDDISLIEKYSDEKIEIVYGNEENFKLTTPLDFKLARIIGGDKSD